MAIDRANPDDAPDIEEMIEELEKKVERLKILYEQYFMGIERMEPQTARKEVTRKLLELTQMNIRNTALRYRFNALNQKCSVYASYWGRTLRAIENGTYMRNVARAGRDAVRRGVEMPDEVLKALPARLRERLMKDRAAIDVRDKKEAERQQKKAELIGKSTGVTPAVTAPPVEDDFDAAFDNLLGGEKPRSPAPPPPPPAARTAVPRPPPPIPPPRRSSIELPPGMDETSARQLFDRYVSAKKVVGEDVSKLKFEGVIGSLAKQAPKIISDHKARGVDFSVVIKDQKVILKATPKK